ncbi:MAG TPA: hypothetical protein VHW90_11775 [Stellaceae bacterium]|jgi:hypothetical protein|nr:hypothetical protein [Stellaceae bacterium]
MASHSHSTTAPVADVSTAVRARIGMLGKALKQRLYRALEALAEHGDRAYPDKQYPLIRFPF